MDKDTRQSETPSIVSRMASAARGYAAPLAVVTALTGAFADRAHGSTTVVDSKGHEWSCDNDVDDLDGDGTRDTDYNTRGSVYAFSGTPGAESTVAVMDGSILDTEFTRDGVSFSSLRSQIEAIDPNAATSSIAITGFAPDKNEAILRVAGSSMYLLDGYRSGSFGSTDLGSSASGSYGSVDNTETEIAVYDGSGADVDIADWYSGSLVYSESGNQSTPVIDRAGARLGMYESGDFYIVNNLGDATQVADLMVENAAPTQYLDANNSPFAKDTFIYITTSGHSTPFQALYCVNEDSAPTVVETDTDGDGVADADDAFPADASETIDSDGDGTGNNADAFDSDASETTDSDGDGMGDNSDPYPTDATNTPPDTGGEDTGDTGEECPDEAQAAPAELCGVEGGSADVIDGDIEVDEEGTIHMDGVPDAITVESEEGETVSVEISLEGQATIPALVSGSADIILGFEDGVSDFAPPPDADEPTVKNVYAQLTVEENSSVVLAGETYGPGTHYVLVGTQTTEEPEVDTDGDGVSDSEDAFPTNADETSDRDEDGVGDNADEFPDDASENADSDNDGIGDNSDAFPNDASENLDSDGDGIGDNSDPYPEDPTNTPPDEDTDTAHAETPRDEGGCSTGSTDIPGALGVGVAFGVALARRKKEEELAAN